MLNNNYEAAASWPIDDFLHEHKDFEKLSALCLVIDRLWSVLFLFVITPAYLNNKDFELSKCLSSEDNKMRKTCLYSDLFCHSFHLSRDLVSTSSSWDVLPVDGFYT